ncbi:MAG: hypothetical protein AB1405_05400 [Bdellovibrionota bacterium]
MPKERKNATPGADLGDAIAKAIKSKDGAAIAALWRDDLPKDAKKEIRKAAHRLRSSGVEVKLPEAETPLAAPEAKAPEAQAYLTAADGTGRRVLWLFFPKESGGEDLLNVYWNDERGLERIEYVPGLPRKRTRSLRDSFRSPDAPPVAPVEAAHAHALLEEAEARTREVGAALPDGFSELHRRVEMLPRSAALSPHPAEALAGEVTDRALAEAARSSAKLLDELPPFLWWPSQAVLRQIDERLSAIESSTVIVSPAQSLEQIEGVFEKTARESLAGEGRARAARRFLDSAWIFHKLGKKELAQTLARLGLAAAKLADETPAFLRESLRRPFQPYLEQKLKGQTGPPAKPALTDAPRPGKLIVPG